MKELKDEIPSLNVLLLAFEEWGVKNLLSRQDGDQ